MFVTLFLSQILESQVEVRQKEVEELQGQSQALSQEGKGSEEVDGQRIGVEKKFHSLQAPLKKRRDNLMASREIHQFNRDVEDEIVSRTGVRVQKVQMRLKHKPAGFTERPFTYQKRNQNYNR